MTKKTKVVVGIVAVVAAYLIYKKMSAPATIATAKPATAPATAAVVKPSTAVTPLVKPVATPAPAAKTAAPAATAKTVVVTQPVVAVKK